METTRFELYKRIPIPDVKRFEEFRLCGEIDESLYQDTLNKKMVGKEFDGYTSRYSPYHLFRMMVGASPIYKEYEKNLLCTADSPQYGVVKYKGVPLFSYEIRKKKSKPHRNVLGGVYYSWDMVSVKLNHFPKDLLARFKEIDQGKLEKARKEADEEERLYRMFSDIVKAFPDRSMRSVFSDLEKICGKGYRLPLRYEADHKK